MRTATWRTLAPIDKGNILMPITIWAGFQNPCPVCASHLTRISVPADGHEGGVGQDLAHQIRARGHARGIRYLVRRKIEAQRWRLTVQSSVIGSFSPGSASRKTPTVASPWGGVSAGTSYVTRSANRISADNNSGRVVASGLLFHPS